MTYSVMYYCENCRREVKIEFQKGETAPTFATCPNCACKDTAKKMGRYPARCPAPLPPPARPKFIVPPPSEWETI